MESEWRFNVWDAGMALSEWTLAARDLRDPRFYWVRGVSNSDGLTVLRQALAFLPNLVWEGQFVPFMTYAQLLANGWIGPD